MFFLHRVSARSVILILTIMSNRLGEEKIEVFDGPNETKFISWHKATRAIRPIAASFRLTFYI